MAKNYASLAFTESIKQIQEKYGSRSSYARMEKQSIYDGLTESEIDFIQERDSFYVASIGENNFPYIQHRGGAKGFLKAIDKKTLAFLDFRGNMQFITLGNLGNNNHVALMLMDYARRTRLKIYAKAEIMELDENEDLSDFLAIKDYKAKPERIMLFHVEAYDWNCPQHITPRFTIEEMKELLASQQEYVMKLEAQVKELMSMIKD
jgi:uncharacterized protein